MVDEINLLDTSKITELVDRYKPFVVEVKKRLMSLVIAFVGATLLGFIFYEQLIKLLIALLNLDGVNIVFTSPFQFINLAVSCGLALGLIVVFPLLVFQILSFVRPALKRLEYRMVKSLIPFAIFLFLVGFVLGVIVMRWQIEIFTSKSELLGIQNILDFSSLLSTILLTSAFLGVGFQFPIVLIVLQHYDIVNRKQLAKARKWVYLGSFMFALVLPPESIIADIFLSLPLIFLFELSLVLGVVFRRKTKK